MSLQTAAQAIITDVDDIQNDDGLQTVAVSRKLIETLRAELALASDAKMHVLMENVHNASNALKLGIAVCEASARLDRGETVVAQNILTSCIREIKLRT